MTPKEFQQQVCKRIVARLDAQQVKGKASRTKRALDMLCGAAAALEASQSDYLNGLLVVATLASVRDGVVESIAATGELQ